MRKLSVIFLVLFVVVFSGCKSLSDSSQKLIPQRGVSSSVPAERWDYGFLTGNGRMGVIVYGQPSHETIVFNQGRLYLPHPRPPVVDLGKSFPELRRVMREKGFQATKEFSIKEAEKQGHFNYHSDPFHLAFELNVNMPVKGSVTNYLRTTNFETGEVAVNWSDDAGKYVRKLFVSRPDNVVVMSIKRSDSKPLSLSILPNPVVHEYVRSDLSIDKEWITYRNVYVNSQGGYDNVVRVITKGGSVGCDGKKIDISDANEVLLITRVEWYEKCQDGSVQALKSSLGILQADYQALLKPHFAEHGKIFNRVKLDLGGGDDRRLTSEELITKAKATGYKNAPPALLEKMYDASRFYFICSAGEVPPNLQGIWNGVFTAPWNGSFTFDANVENAMDAALSGNMMEGMAGYFRMIESFLPDWRINAQKLFGARGILSQIVASSNTGLHYHYTADWPWQLWTPGAGWLASYFYDYYLFTGDKVFLAQRALPLMKEIALFYEDFLTEKDANGHFIYRPSLSPEVYVSSDSPYAGAGQKGLLLSDNSTMDVAVAKELLTNLIASCEELKIDSENVVKWKAMLKMMPPYQIGPDGDLAEWADGSFRHLYDHRHHSPFYPLFRSFEFSPDSTPELWKAARVALKKKGEQWLHNPKADNFGIPFGLSFHAQSAAYLGQGDVVEEILNLLADRVYPSLHMSLGPDGYIFNFDGNGAFPDIINRSFAFSLNGTLDLLRSVPPGWNEGTISGILVRGQITIDRMQWNLAEGVVNLELTSAIEQQVTLRVMEKKSIDLKVVKGTAKIEDSEQGANARKVTLPAGKKVSIRVELEKNTL